MQLGISGGGKFRCRGLKLMGLCSNDMHMLGTVRSGKIERASSYPAHYFDNSFPCKLWVSQLPSLFSVSTHIYS